MEPSVGKVNVAATVVRDDPSNDTKKIREAMGQLGKDLIEVEKSIAKMKKLQALIAKQPEECAKKFKDLHADRRASGLEQAAAAEPVVIGTATLADERADPGLLAQLRKD